MMRRRVAAAIAIPLAVAACGTPNQSDSPPPEPPRGTYSWSLDEDITAQDRFYLTFLRQSLPDGDDYVVTEEAGRDAARGAINRSRTVCTVGFPANSYDQTVLILTAGDGAISEEAADAVIRSAVEVYCPQYRDRLPD